MRLLRGLGALAVILVGLVGVPFALVVVGGDVLPDSSSWASISRALLRPDDGTVLIGLITVLAWIAWLVFTASLVVEILKMVSGYRVDITLPGFGGPQRLVAGLLLAVLALVPAQASQAAPSPGPAQPTVTASESRGGSTSTPPERLAEDRSAASTPAQGPTSVAGNGGGHAATAHTHPRQQTLAPAGSVAAGSIHVVERGDDLWSLAEHYYGQGRQWRKIAAANPKLLTGGPDHLQTGWELTIPDLDGPRDASSRGSVVVKPGDTLSSLAEQAYGTSSRWPDIYEANRAQIEDPDDIEAGARLTLPRPADHPSRDHDVERSRPSGHSEQSEADGVDRSPLVRVDTPDRPAPSNAPTPAPLSPRPVPTADVSSGGATPTEHPKETASEAAALDHVLGVGAVGGLLAAALMSGLAIRRRSQLQTRPLGRRIHHPDPGVQAVETALGRRQSPLSLGTLDLAIRAIAAHCHNTCTPLPPLVLAKVGPALIELVMSESTRGAPVGFKESGRSWFLEHADASYLSSVPGVAEALRPFPALVSLGFDREGNHVMADIESMGLLSVHADGEVAESALAAIAVELSCSPWSDEMFLTLVGSAVDLPDAVGKHNVVRADDLDDVLTRLERRAVVQREHQSVTPMGRNRVDPDLADAWAPEIVLINQRLSNRQAERLRALTAHPRVTIGAVVADTSAWTQDAAAPWALVLEHPTGGPASGSGPSDSTSAPRATLQPLGLELAPQLLPAPAQQAAVELLRVTGDQETTPAPWWHHEIDPPAVPPPDNVTYLGKRFGGWGSEASTASGEGAEPVIQAEFGETGQVSLHHPVLQLLGPVELLGARGRVPARAAKQCLEYCGWLLEHPGTTAQAMASALVVAEGTRRSNMSRLRTWLGVDVAGEAYLPDAYTGRILLHPSVSSDWQRLQILTAVGVNKTSTNGLRAALELVRGAPLADAAPGQWHWAEELRTDMISAVRDIGVELSSRALLEHDLELARWAAARALAAAPGDELLLAARIRTEHLAGNIPETERLALQLAAQARTLGVDLDGDTVVLLQEVMEGRVRARMA